MPQELHTISYSWWTAIPFFSDNESRTSEFSSCYCFCCCRLVLTTILSPVRTDLDSCYRQQQPLLWNSGVWSIRERQSIPPQYQVCTGEGYNCMVHAQVHDKTNWHGVNMQENYVPKSDVSAETQAAEFDVILALSLSKWIHLNWGDAGIKRFFKKVYHHLHPGGKFILEPQPFNSYSKKKRLTVSWCIQFKR